MQRSYLSWCNTIFAKYILIQINAGVNLYLQISYACIILPLSWLPVSFYRVMRSADYILSQDICPFVARRFSVETAKHNINIFHNRVATPVLAERNYTVKSKCIDCRYLVLGSVPLL